MPTLLERQSPEPRLGGGSRPPCSGASLEGSKDALAVAVMREEVYAKEEGMHTLEMRAPLAS